MEKQFGAPELQIETKPKKKVTAGNDYVAGVLWLLPHSTNMQVDKPGEKKT